MAYGIIEYNHLGKPICEICGKPYDRVLSHVRQKHNMDEKSYKKKFGFDLTKGICSKDSALKTRIQTLKNFDKCVGKNLIDRGVNSRFEKGCKGRTKEKVSEQTRLALMENTKNFKHSKKND